MLVEEDPLQAMMPAITPTTPTAARTIVREQERETII